MEHLLQDVFICIQYSKNNNGIVQWWCLLDMSPIHHHHSFQMVKVQMGNKLPTLVQKEKCKAWQFTPLGLLVRVAESYHISTVYEFPMAATTKYQNVEAQ